MNASTTHHVPRLFEPELLRRAGWIAMAYATPPDELPTLGLVFQDADAAEAIFTGWRHTVGAEDTDDLLRVAIIEGDIKGTPPGYTVHIGLDLDVLAERARLAPGSQATFDPANVDAWRRMPDPTSPHLRRFKESLLRQRRYHLAPASLTSRTTMMAHQHLRIVKRRLVFRRVGDVGLVGDPDAGLWLR